MCLVATVGLLIYAAFNVWVYQYSKGGNASSPVNVLKGSGLPTPTPSPRPIPSGKKTFSVSSGKKTGPQFQSGAIDPYDPKIKAAQTISVTIISTNPVTTVTLSMQTDTKTKKVPMSIINGTLINGVWAGTWTVDDSYLYTYVATITASDGAETNKIDLTLR